MKAGPAPKRLPKNHQAVYEVMRTAGAGVHLTTGELFARARAAHPAIGFSTVYRGVQRLRDLALIDEIVVPGADAAVYELAAEPHAHFRCERCGNVEDVAFALPPRTLAELRRQTHAQIDRARVTLHGLCQSCSERT